MFLDIIVQVREQMQWQPDYNLWQQWPILDFNTLTEENLISKLELRLKQNGVSNHTDPVRTALRLVNNPVLNPKRKRFHEQLMDLRQREYFDRLLEYTQNDAQRKAFWNWQQDKQNKAKQAKAWETFRVLQASLSSRDEKNDFFWFWRAAQNPHKVLDESLDAQMVRNTKFAKKVEALKVSFALKPEEEELQRVDDLLRSEHPKKVLLDALESASIQNGQTTNKTFEQSVLRFWRGLPLTNRQLLEKDYLVMKEKEEEEENNETTKAAQNETWFFANAIKSTLESWSRRNKDALVSEDEKHKKNAQRSIDELKPKIKAWMDARRKKEEEKEGEEENYEEEEEEEEEEDGGTDDFKTNEKAFVNLVQVFSSEVWDVAFDNLMYANRYIWPRINNIKWQFLIKNKAVLKRVLIVKFGLSQDDVEEFLTQKIFTKLPAFNESSFSKSTKTLRAKAHKSLEKLKDADDRFNMASLILAMFPITPAALEHRQLWGQMAPAYKLAVVFILEKLHRRPDMERKAEYCDFVKQVFLVTEMKTRENGQFWKLAPVAQQQRLKSPVEDSDLFLESQINMSSEVGRVLWQLSKDNSPVVDLLTDEDKWELFQNKKDRRGDLTPKSGAEYFVKYLIDTIQPWVTDVVEVEKARKKALADKDEFAEDEEEEEEKKEEAPTPPPPITATGEFGVAPTDAKHLEAAEELGPNLFKTLLQNANESLQRLMITMPDGAKTLCEERKAAEEVPQKKKQKPRGKKKKTASYSAPPVQHVSVGFQTLADIEKQKQFVQNARAVENRLQAEKLVELDMIRKREFAKEVAARKAEAVKADEAWVKLKAKYLRWKDYAEGDPTKNVSEPPGWGPEEYDILKEDFERAERAKRARTR